MEKVPFKLRTQDADWIKRHKGQVDDAGRVTVMLPVNQVAHVPFSGRMWLRHTFRDCPKDFPNATVMCPVKWVAP